MSEELLQLGNTIIKEKHNIAETVHRERLGEVTMSEQEKWAFQAFESNIIKIRMQFIELLGEGIRDSAKKEVSFGKIAKWGEETGELFF